MPTVSADGGVASSRIRSWAPMPPEERNVWYAITLVATGVVMIGIINQTGLGEFLTIVGGLWILYLERVRIRDGARKFLNIEQPSSIRGAGYDYLAPDLTTTINIQDPKGGQVPHRKTVKGFVQPPTGSV